MHPLLLDIDWSFFNKVYFNQKVSDYLLFLVIVLATQLLKKPLTLLIARWTTSLAMKYSYLKHKEKILDLLFKPIERLLQIILYFIATEQLAHLLDQVVFQRGMVSKSHTAINLGDITDHIFLFLFIFFLTRLVNNFIDFVYYIRMNKAVEENNSSREQMLPLIKEISKLITWILGGFWILGSVFHVNVPALITGLGIGGVAIALAGKETVENFFAAFTILSDRPFMAGDMIKLGEIEGTVERIGFRSTRIRNMDGSLYIIANQSLISKSLVNLSNRNTRGMKVIANIRYGISHADLTLLVNELKATLIKIHPVKEPVTAIVETFDKETFQLVVAYHLPHPLPEDKTLLALKHEINLKVFEIIGKHAKLGALPGTS